MTNFEYIIALIQFVITITFLISFGIFAVKEIKIEREFYASERGFKLFMEREITKREYIKRTGKRP